MPNGIRRCNMGIGYCAQEGLQQTMDSKPLDARKPADLQTKKIPRRKPRDQIE